MTAAPVPTVDSPGQSENPFEDRAADSDAVQITPPTQECAETVNTSESTAYQSAVASSKLNAPEEEFPTLRVVNPEPVPELTEPSTSPPAHMTPAPQATEEALKELHREVFPTDLPPRPQPKRNFFARLLSRPADRPVDIELANQGAQQPVTDGMVDVDLGNQTSSNNNWRPKQTFNHTLLRKEVLLPLISAAFVMFVLWGMAIVYQNNNGGDDGGKGGEEGI